MILVLPFSNSNLTAHSTNNLLQSPSRKTNRNVYNITSQETDEKRRDMHLSKTRHPTTIFLILLVPTIFLQLIEVGAETVNEQVFTQSSVWTVPTGVTQISVTLIGGGGGGQAGWGNYGGFGGAGAGGKAGALVATTITVTPGQVLTITVGSGGVGGSTEYVCDTCPDGAPGNDGGSSDIAGFSTTTAAGGQGGAKWLGKGNYDASHPNGDWEGDGGSWWYGYPGQDSQLGQGGSKGQVYTHGGQGGIGAGGGGGAASNYDPNDYLTLGGNGGNGYVKLSWVEPITIPTSPETCPATYSWPDPTPSNAGNVFFEDCSNHEFLSNGAKLLPCEWTGDTKTISGHQYICANAGAGGWVECCGSGDCLKGDAGGTRKTVGQTVTYTQGQQFLLPEQPSVHWEQSAWGECDCITSTQTSTVSCKDSYGQTVPNDNCGSNPPPTSQSCHATSCHYTSANGGFGYNCNGPGVSASMTQFCVEHGYHWYTVVDCVSSCDYSSVKTWTGSSWSFSYGGDCPDSNTPGWISRTITCM